METIQGASLLDSHPGVLEIILASGDHLESFPAWGPSQGPRNHPRLSRTILGSWGPSLTLGNIQGVSLLRDHPKVSWTILGS